MRLAFLVSFNLLIAACGGGSDSNQAPKQSRECGELDGVQPVEPVILGEDAWGCPVFAPVPCTKPRAQYEDLCGAEAGCSPKTAANADGDTWLVGCAYWPPSVDGCGGPDYLARECGRDPFEGDVFWFWVNECDPIFMYYYDCWTPCDGAREPTESSCL